MSTKHEKSAAAVVFHNNNGEVEYLLLHYPSSSRKKKEGHWGYVKGHIEAGESEKATLMREAEEETGLSFDQLDLKEDFKEKIEYWFKKEGNLIHKTVVFFLLESKSKKITLSAEHDDYDWLSYKKAKKKLTFDNAKELLTAAKAATDTHQ